MNQCDNCQAKTPKVEIAADCPECGQLVGWPVPDNGSTAAALSAYDVEDTDDQLAFAVSAVAENHFNTLLRRKRKAEAALGLKVPAPEGAADREDTGDEQPATPPNADPAQATDPSVQPQPDADSDQGPG
jgi:hypothetical protein